MRVLIALTYYRPHISGLTVYVERLSKALADAGHTVTVLTSRYDDSLPQQSESDGVRVVRVPVAVHVGKGVVMPAHGRAAGRLIADARRRLDPRAATRGCGARPSGPAA